MPAQDVVPLAFALEQGIFGKHGVNIELICGGNMLERNTAFLSGQIDALATDLTSAVLLLGRQASAAIVGTLFEPAPDPRNGNQIVRTVAMLTHKFSSYRAVEDIVKTGPRRQITLVQPSDMEYLTDTLLQSKGVKAGDVDRYYTGVEDFDKIQVIAQLLGAGTVSVQVAVLPEPHATLTEVVAQANNIEILTLADYKSLRTPPSVLLFRRQVLEERGVQVSKFFQAFKEAVTTLNASPRDFIIDTLIKAGVNICFPELRGEELKFPEGWRDRLHVPYFPAPRALQSSEFDAHINWALGKRYIREKLTFAAATDFRFLG
jgi:NitT/TauT family transport system substrate-binding protein